MAKLSKKFSCENCGVSYPAWQGQCSACGEWNTIVEQKIFENDTQILSRGFPGKVSFQSLSGADLQLENLTSISEKSNNQSEQNLRFATGVSEFDRVLGGGSGAGGLVTGSVVLLTGEPGIGKSTLLSQVGLHLAQTQKVVYVSAEESLGQISLRLERLSRGWKGLSSESKQNFQLASVNNLERIMQLIVQENDALQKQAGKKDRVNTPRLAGLPRLVVMIDSIQTISSGQIAGIPGGMAQVRYCASELISLAKNLGVTLILVGHINKEGEVAGPKILEHLVDLVLLFQGEERWGLRSLRSLKNRFGSTDELGLFTQTETGLLAIENPAEFFELGLTAMQQSPEIKEKIRQELKPQIGSCKTVVLEGKRPLLLEIQVLATKTDFAYPKRVSEGVPLARLQLITAIATKYLRLNLHEYDIYLSVANGFKINDRAADLAILMALLSSVRGKSLPRGSVAFGEINLSGVISPGIWSEKRLQEAEKFHYKSVYSATNNHYVADVAKIFAA